MNLRLLIGGALAVVMACGLGIGGDPHGVARQASGAAGADTEIEADDDDDGDAGVDDDADAGEDVEDSDGGDDDLDGGDDGLPDHP